MNRVVHPIPPLFDAKSRVLILGTMPSPKSREAGFYYMHPQNRFWRVLAALFLQPVPPPDPAARAAFALAHGVALWDVLASCEINGASDAAIKHPVANDLSVVLAHASIHAIFTTGTKATQLYDRYIYPTTQIAATGLPSTSPANCACSFEALCAAYQPILTIFEEEV